MFYLSIVFDAPKKYISRLNGMWWMCGCLFTTARSNCQLCFCTAVAMRMYVCRIESERGKDEENTKNKHAVYAMTTALIWFFVTIKLADSRLNCSLLATLKRTHSLDEIGMLCYAKVMVEMYIVLFYEKKKNHFGGNWWTKC